MKLTNQLILASNSPRRKQILSDAGFEFIVKVKEVEEDFPADMHIIDVPVFLATKKAKSLENEINTEIVLASDTIVAIDGEILNKPADENEAKIMLRKLSGCKHVVHTGVCILTKKSINTFVDTTEVYFKSLSENEIDFYIKKCKPFDKAGAYGVQDFIGMIGIDRIEGSFFTVMGLPIHLVYKALSEYILFDRNVFAKD